jgi:parallel beta-helix repeat protein
MITRRVLSTLFVAAIVLSATAVMRSEADAAGTINGDLPTSGGLALVGWSGGPTTDLIDVSQRQGCALDSVWTFVGGFPIGYLVDAPAFVNSRHVAVYPSGEMPQGTVLLVCRRTRVFQPGDDVRSLIAAQPHGTKFIFGPGIYRGANITVRNGDTFEGQPGAILSGARVLQGFEFDGNRWSIGGQTSQLEGSGSCDEFLGQGYDGCQRPEQLFIDGQPLWQVTRSDQLAPGRWYFDYGADRVYLADNPDGRLVELSVTPVAFSGQARDVTISGLVIEKYANRAQHGAIDAAGSNENWLIVDSEIRYNHGTGVRTGTDMVFRDNWVHHNGQNGIGGRGDRILVEGNEISFNGISGFNPFWEAGGTKWVLTHDLVVRNNHVHHNFGRGIWTDIDNVDSLIEGNLVENNDQSGIAHEISYAATIRNNVVRNNGLSFDVWVWGAQILVQNSSDTTVTGNTVTVAASGGDGIAVVNQNRGSGNLGNYVSRNVTVRNNDVTYLGNVGQSGVADDTGGFACQSNGNNTFDANTYHGGTATTKLWFWCGDLNWTGMQSRGAEPQGTHIPR